MKKLDLLSLAAQHTRNALAEAVYIAGGPDVTRPVSIYGELVERCNYKCRYCDYWRRPKYREELTIAEWQAALLDLKSFIGRFHIEFSGGEPYIKKGFLDLARFCRDQDLHWGVTTNGGAFRNAKIVAETVAARPSNVNISVDSARANIHDYARGVEGSLEDIVAGLAALNAEKRAQGVDFPIIVKAVVHRLNFRDLPDLIDWASAHGAEAVNFQPVARETEEVAKELWIEADDFVALEAVVDRLIERKRLGAPIVNSEILLRSWQKHFLDGKASKDLMPCRIGLRNYFIRSDGSVEMCWKFPPIGNVKTQKAHEIWRGAEGKTRRRETTQCETLCLFTCLSQKTLADKVKMATTIFNPFGVKR
jgi:radical SAM protein with 4Fe4S-binding SPASM domain